MINQKGFKVLLEADVRGRKLGIFLLAHFDLSKYVSIQPSQLQAMGLKLNETTIVVLIDLLVRGGFLEYGPVVPRKRVCNRFGTVPGRSFRIRQNLLIKPWTAKEIANQARARAERHRLLSSAVKEIQGEVDAVTASLKAVESHLGANSPLCGG